MIPVSLPGSRRVETHRGDTLQAIAARVLGDANRWRDLASINNLQPPYIVDNLADVVPGVLLAGSLLIVPGAAAQPSAVTDPNSIFGTDVALVDGLLTDDGMGDLAVVSGPANLVQAVKHRLDTPAGSLIWHPAYGCRVQELLGRGVSPPLLQLAASFIKGAIAQDPRISAASITATADGDRIAASGGAVTVDGSTLPVSTVF